MQSFWRSSCSMAWGCRRVAAALTRRTLRWAETRRGSPPEGIPTDAVSARYHRGANMNIDREIGKYRVLHLFVLQRTEAPRGCRCQAMVQILSIHMVSIDIHTGRRKRERTIYKVPLREVHRHTTCRHDRMQLPWCWCWCCAFLSCTGRRRLELFTA